MLHVSERQFGDSFSITACSNTEESHRHNVKQKTKDTNECFFYVKKQKESGQISHGNDGPVAERRHEGLLETDHVLFLELGAGYMRILIL